MTRTLLLGAAAIVATTAMAVSTPASARDGRIQGGMANPNNLTIVGQQRSMRQNELLKEMRRLRAEAKAVKVRNGGTLPEAEKASLQQRLDALKAEYRQAS